MLYLPFALADSEVRHHVVETLQRVSVASPSRVVDYYPHQLSGGMKQRALIAMALLSRPSLIIADEPTSSLDVTIQSQILNLLQSLRKDFSYSLILITHDLGLTAEICDKVSVMYAGKIVEQSDVYSLYQKPSHPYTRALLESVLSIDEFKENIRTISGDVPHLLSLPRGCRFHPRCHHKMEICTKKDPPYFNVGCGHTSACWLHADDSTRG